VRIKPRTLVNIGLLVLVTIAAAVLYWTRVPEPASTFPVLPAALEEVQRIELERSSGMRVALAREHGRWRMQLPVAARLDDMALARILEFGRAQSQRRMPAADLQRFDLDQPWARIRFDSHVIELGMTNQMTQELYVRSGDHVHVLPARYTANVPGDASKLISHRLFAADEDPVAFRLERFSVRKESGRWLAEPDKGELSQDDLLRWVDQWRLASSIITQPQTDAPARAAIAVELRDGRTIPMHVIALAPDFVVRRADERLEYHFTSRLASVLLAAPGAAETKH
jgi:hypothetical protein